jgi:hypothetical protein
MKTFIFLIGFFLTFSSFLPACLKSTADYGCGYQGSGIIIRSLLGHWMWEIEDKPLDLTYREVCKKGVAWLMKMAEEESDTYKWPFSEKEQLFFPLDNMTINLLLAYLYRATTNNLYFNFYTKGERWVWKQKIEISPSAFCWPKEENSGPVYVAITEYGTAGVGLLFLGIYKLTRDSLARKCAIGAAEWLKEIAFKPFPGGAYWPRLVADDGKTPLDTRWEVGWCWGSAGICYFLYKMYQEFGIVSYKELADSGLNWLTRKAVKENGGYKWPRRKGEREKYLTTWGKGAASIGYVFLLGYQISGKEEYLEMAKGAAEWLISQATPTENNGYKWLDEQATPPRYDTRWCKGAPPISLFFAELWKETGKEKYLPFALGAYRWLESIKVEDPIAGGITWESSKKDPNFALPDNNAGSLSIIRRTGEICQRDEFLDFFHRAATWIVAQRVEEENTYKWPVAVDISSLLNKTKMKNNSSENFTQSYPNPFNPECWIPVNVKGKIQSVKCKIYNILGQLVREIKISNPKFQILKSIYWDGRNSQGREITSSIYFYQLEADGLIKGIKQMILLR